MNKFFLMVCVLFVISLSSMASATEFTFKGVWSSIEEYDQTDFPGQTSVSVMYAVAMVNEYNGDTVKMDSIPTGNDIPLPWDETNQLYFETFTSPPIGDQWKTAYTFHISSGSDTTLDLSNCPIRQLATPQVTISADGRTISWNVVEHASRYRVWLYQIDPSSGLPTGAPIYQADKLTDTSFTLPNPPASAGVTNAVRVIAEELCGSNIINRSNLYRKSTFTDNPAIPTLSEWGMIFFALIIAASAIFVMRRRQRA